MSEHGRRTGRERSLLRSLVGVPDAPGRTIYCVPSAGTGARTFLAQHARTALRGHLRVVQLPGREDRLREAVLEDVTVMAGLVAQAVAAELPRDYALFGHSFGALVMLEAARALQRAGAPPPAVLAVAACSPPHLPALDRFQDMTPQEIFQTLQVLGGLDLGGPGGDQLKALVLPALAADAAAGSRYVTHHCGPDVASDAVETVDVPVLAMGGTLDAAVPPERLADWQRYSTAGARTVEFAGGHFFPLESELPLLAVRDWPD